MSTESTFFDDLFDLIMGYRKSNLLRVETCVPVSDVQAPRERHLRVGSLTVRDVM